jgi:hypothetical protein
MTMMQKSKFNVINAVPDVPGLPYIGVTRACVRASTVDMGVSGISGTPRKSAVLALDLGTTTGWAMQLADGAIVSGTVSFRPGRYEGGGMRFLRFRSWLEEMLRSAPGLATVHFEEVRRHVGTDAAHIYGGFLAHLAAWCEMKMIPYQGVSVGTIKRHATGKGNADKQAVIAAMKSRGFAPTDDNEADAIAILLWAIETEGGVR